MKLNTRNIMLILRKEWWELKQQRSLWLGMAFLPLLFTAMPLIIIFIAGVAPTDEFDDLQGMLEAVKLNPAWQGLSERELAQALIGQPLSVLAMLSPVILPSILASYSIVGEKTNQTLEPVLATPVATWELLLAKSLVALVPSVAITWAFGLIFIAGVWVIAVSQRVFAAIVSPGWLLLFVLAGPLLALLTVEATVAVSSRVNDPRTAQQISAVVVVPLMAIILGQFTGLLVLSPLLSLGVVAVLALLAWISIVVASRLFEREAILTRWS